MENDYVLEVSVYDRKKIESLTIEEIEKLNIHKKINYIQNDFMEVNLSGMNKQYGAGKNGGGNYKKFSDCKRAVVRKMNKLGLVLELRDIEPKDMQLTITGNTISYINRMAIVDSDSEKELPFCFPFVSSNAGGVDKASGGAITYALKYIFNLWWLIPDETLDPDTWENTESRDKEKKEIKEKDEALKNLIEKVNSDKLFFKWVSINLKERGLKKPKELSIPVIKEIEKTFNVGTMFNQELFNNTDKLTEVIKKLGKEKENLSLDEKREILMEVYNV